ncbi:hypothetical protein ACHAPJ_010353 [Fusarium lateritium]
MYLRMKPLLQNLTRNEKTMATRQLKPGENITSLWDTVIDERSKFRLFDITGKSVTFRSDAKIAESPYMFYDDVNAAEDAILFPDELLTNKKKINAHKSLAFDRRMDVADPMEMMERDRSFSFKETPHAGPTDWVWFLAEILDWFELRGDYDDYIQDPQAPWPYSFIVQDLVQAFAMTAMFFPESNKTKLVTMFINSVQCEEFRKSGLFDQKERSKTRPDRGTRTSYKFCEKEFWKEWKDFYEKKTEI